MLKHLSLFLIILLISTFIPHELGAPALAQDGEDSAPEDTAEEAATDRRPFNCELSDEEVHKAIEDAVNGDSDALKKLEDGRLGYMHILTRDRRAHSFSHQLMRAEIGWVRDMQRWEALLMGVDASLMESTFVELRDRFYHEEGQLSRAFIKAHDLGELGVAARLAKLAPDSPWISACKAWVGEVSDTTERIRLLLEILPESMELSVWGWNLSPGLLDDSVRRKGYGTGAYARAECPLFMTRDGINRLGQLPSEWTFGNFFERLGALAHELPEEEKQKVGIQVLEIIGQDESSGSRYQSFEFGAWPEKQYQEPPVAYSEMNLAHSTIVMRYAKDSLADEPLSRRFAAISTFWGQPDWEPGQAFLLSEALASADTAFANIAMRAVLLVNPDSVRAISSVARALAGADQLKTEQDAFKKALKSSGKKVLQQIAEGHFPSTPDNPGAGLDVSGQAALLEPFLHDDELTAYGGLEAAWWMNRSQFLFAQHKASAAMEASCRSIELAAKNSERKIAQSNAYLTHRTLRSMLGVSEVESWLGAWKDHFPLATEFLRRQAEAWQADKFEGVEFAVFAVERELTGGAVADDEQFEALKTDPSIAGGYGLNLAAFTEARSFNYETKQRLMDAAERATPTDWSIYFQAMPYSDWFGRFVGRDWTVAEHLTQCVALLQPYNWTTFTKLGGLLARNGCNPRCMSPLLAQALNRPIQPYQGGNSTLSMTRLLFSRFNVSYLLQTNGGVNSEHIPEGWREMYVGALEKSAWGLDWWEPMQWGPRLSPRGGFAMACYQNEYHSRDKENVSLLLDYALELQGTLPEGCLKLVAEAERIGVSAYGHFVGSQTYIRVKARLGEYDAALKRWEALRDGDAGYPPYLDYMLLHGLCEGNQWEHVNDALDHVLEYEQEQGSVYLTFALRRALMAAGRHEDVSDVSPPNWITRSGDAYNNGNYTEVFYEARRLFELGEYNKIAQRVAELNRGGAEVGIGVTLDAHLLRALAEKLQSEEDEDEPLDDNGLLQAIHEDDFWWWRPSTTLDYCVLEVLVGLRKYKDLPQISEDTTWHGLKYGERPQAYKGTGLMREGEAMARDDFVRGVIAFLANDAESARKHLKACVDANQRCSHEYHVAEWLLEKQMPKKD